MTTTSSPTSTMQGVAGRTNYAQWDKLANDLVKQVDEEAKKEEEEEKAKLGLDGKYAVSADDAAERAKAEQAKRLKEKLDALKARETAKILELRDFQTLDSVPLNKRVIRICDMTGPGEIVLSKELSKLECVVDTTNPLAKSFPDDAENAAEHQPGTTVYGLIKVMIDNVKDATIVMESKLITGTIEMHQCDNVKLMVSHESITTLQVDVCNHCSIHFTSDWNSKTNRILHAGCRNLKITTNTNQQIIADYVQDGAKAVGNATVKEFQFITSKIDDTLVTEAVVKSSGGIPMTQRDLEQATANRNKAASRAMELAEQMVKMTDQDGNPLVVTKTDSTVAVESNSTVEQCETFKLQGNEAFAAGEYAQALLHYSLAIDKTAELTDTTLLFPVDIVYSNRAAAFLKLGQHEKALADADDALKINPDNLKALFRKGLALHAASRYYEALPILAAAHKREPKNQQIKQALQFCEVRVEQENRKRMAKQ